jgi:hypothetical protein
MQLIRGAGLDRIIDAIGKAPEGIAVDSLIQTIQNAPPRQHQAARSPPHPSQNLRHRYPGPPRLSALPTRLASVTTTSSPPICSWMLQVTYGLVTSACRNSCRRKRSERFREQHRTHTEQKKPAVAPCATWHRSVSVEFLPPQPISTHSVPRSTNSACSVSRSVTTTPKPCGSRSSTSHPSGPAICVASFPGDSKPSFSTVCKRTRGIAIPAAESLLQDLLRFTHGRRIRSTRRSRFAAILHAVASKFHH